MKRDDFHPSDVRRMQHQGIHFEEAGFVGDDRKKIKGYANTWKLMRSGRLIHPDGVEEWLKANPEPRIPLLAQHGYVPGFATIGVVNVLKVDRKRGLYFEATLADGTDLTQQAVTLIDQGMLTSLSLGWFALDARWVSKSDADIDPWVAQRLKEEGADAAYVHFRMDLAELSLVDVGDDARAQLTAGLVEELGGELATVLLARIDALEARLTGEGAGRGAQGTADLETVVRAAVEAALGATRKLHENFSAGLENRLAEVCETKLADLAAAYLADDFAACADGGGDDDEADGDASAPGRRSADGAAGPTVAALTARLRRV